MSAYLLPVNGFPLGAPERDKPPMKVNVFEFARSVNTKLAPLFPAYLDKGCIVPTVALITGRPGRKFTMFHHTNCVDEVVTIFAAKGLPLKTGNVMLGGKLHYVNIPMQNPGDERQHTLMVITQRQWERDEPQHEVMTLICQQCQEPLIKHSYVCDADEAEARAIVHRRDRAPMPTVLESARAAEMLNAKPEQLVCKECGFENEPFPLDDWGWKNYAEANQSIADALKNYPVQQGAA